MKQPVLLTFNIPEAVTAKLRLICMRFAIRFQPVPEADWHRSIGALCGYAADEAVEPDAPDAPPLDSPMLVMALFPAGLPQQFLQALKRPKLPPIPLKAILTPTNALWTPTHLHAELTKEREAIASGRKAHE